LILLFGWRCKYHIKDRAFDELLRILAKSILPTDNRLPPSLYLFRKVSPVGHQLLLVSMS
jgi:hypothetical protein